MSGQPSTSALLIGAPAMSRCVTGAQDGLEDMEDPDSRLTSNLSFRYTGMETNDEILETFDSTFGLSMPGSSVLREMCVAEFAGCRIPLPWPDQSYVKVGHRISGFENEQMIQWRLKYLGIPDRLFYMGCLIHIRMYSLAWDEWDRWYAYDDREDCLYLVAGSWRELRHRGAIRMDCIHEDLDYPNLKNNKDSWIYRSARERISANLEKAEGERRRYLKSRQDFSPLLGVIDSKEKILDKLLDLRGKTLSLTWPECHSLQIVSRNELGVPESVICQLSALLAKDESQAVKKSVKPSAILNVRFWEWSDEDDRRKVSSSKDDRGHSTQIAGRPKEDAIAKRPPKKRPVSIQSVVEMLQRGNQDNLNKFELCVLGLVKSSLNTTLTLEGVVLLYATRQGGIYVYDGCENRLVQVAEDFRSLVRVGLLRLVGDFRMECIDIVDEITVKGCGPKHCRQITDLHRNLAWSAWLTQIPTHVGDLQQKPCWVSLPWPKGSGVWVFGQRYAVHVNRVEDWSRFYCSTNVLSLTAVALFLEYKKPGSGKVPICSKLNVLVSDSGHVYVFISKKDRLYEVASSVREFFEKGPRQVYELYEPVVPDMGELLSRIHKNVACENVNLAGFLEACQNPMEFLKFIHAHPGFQIEIGTQLKTTWTIMSRENLYAVGLDHRVLDSVQLNGYSFVGQVSWLKRLIFMNGDGVVFVLMPKRRLVRVADRVIGFLHYGMSWFMGMTRFCYCAPGNMDRAIGGFVRFPCELEDYPLPGDDLFCRHLDELQRIRRRIHKV